jgi:protein-S-isoprenylcysteine O-methyltransferase Ste14
MIASGIIGSALVVVAAFAAGTEFAGLRRRRRSFWHLIGQPAARTLRSNVIMVGVGVITVSFQWHNSAVTWSLEGIVAALLVAVAGVELQAWLRHSRSQESSA